MLRHLQVWKKAINKKVLQAIKVLLMSKYISLLILLVFALACNEKKIYFIKNKDLYIKALDCLNERRNIIFPDTNQNQAVSIYRDDLKKYKLCQTVEELFTKHEIDFVDYRKDSTVAFYLRVSGVLKKKQVILMYSPVNKNRITSDMTVLEVHAGSWYEIEKIITLAN